MVRSQFPAKLITVQFIPFSMFFVISAQIIDLQKEKENGCIIRRGLPMGQTII